jgi:hypothetical protein
MNNRMIEFYVEGWHARVHQCDLTKAQLAVCRRIPAIMAGTPSTSYKIVVITEDRALLELRCDGLGVNLTLTR